MPTGRLTIPCDVHTHLLPGVDDGTFTTQSAAETLAQMAEKGIQKVCLTPHVMAGLWDNTPENLRAAMSRLRAALPVGSPEIPELHLGAEYMIDQTLLQTVTERPETLLTVDGSRVLVEMSYYGPSAQLTQVVRGLRRAGLIPLLAHPERYLYMSPGSFEALHDAGCEFQLNLACADNPGAITRHLMARGGYTRVGSDIHSPRQWRGLAATKIDRRIAEGGERAGLWKITSQNT